MAIHTEVTVLNEGPYDQSVVASEKKPGKGEREHHGEEEEKQ